MSLRYSSGGSFQTSISSQEMFNISDEINRNYAPIAPIKQKTSPAKVNSPCTNLLEVSQNISLYYAPKLSSSTKELTLLSINPLQFYTYWNLNENHSHLLSTTMYNDELRLRVYAQPEQGKTPVNSKSIFESPIHSIQGQKKISIPNASENMSYSATIGKCTLDDNFISLITSNELHTLLGNAPTCSIKEDKEKSINYCSKDKLIDFIGSTYLSNTTQSHYASSNHSGRGKKPYYNE